MVMVLNSGTKPKDLNIKTLGINTDDVFITGKGVDIELTQGDFVKLVDATLYEESLPAKIRDDLYLKVTPNTVWLSQGPNVKYIVGFSEIDWAVAVEYVMTNSDLIHPYFLPSDPRQDLIEKVKKENRKPLRFEKIWNWLKTLTPVEGYNQGRQRLASNAAPY